MRLRELVMVRATPRISRATPARGLPCKSTASAWTGTALPTDTQSPALMPAATAAGQSVALPRSVWISPFGSAKVASSASRFGASTTGSDLSVSVPVPLRSSVNEVLSATSFDVDVSSCARELSSSPSVAGALAPSSAGFLYGAKLNDLNCEAKGGDVSFINADTCTGRFDAGPPDTYSICTESGASFAATSAPVF